MRKLLKRVCDFIKLCFGIVGSYFGVVSNVIGAMFGVLASVFVLFIIVGICIYVKVLPMFTEAREEAFDKLVHLSEEDFIMSEDTVIYDAKGKKVGSVNAGRYTYVDIRKISPYIYNGYIAVEDKRFKTHAGVDMLATMRAGVALLKNEGEITQGGSTITQQVVKNNLLTQDKSYMRKLTEIMLAPAVEERFSKDKIMEFYCNSNFYGNRCYGVQAACKYYFGKKCIDIEPEEAALLIALSNSPSAYDPIQHPKKALEKRNQVLMTMEKEGVITKKVYLASKENPLNIVQESEKGETESYITSYAIHCAALALMEQENFSFQYIFETEKDYKSYSKKYSAEYNKKCNEIRGGGYKLYTSINSTKQKQLQKAVNNGLAYNKEKDKKTGKYALQGAAVCVDNESNYVVAIVGGRGTKDSYNRAYLSARQSGSSIKPLLDYTPGFESGLYSPSTMMTDKAIKNGPKNAGGGYRGNVRIREAVARSINTIAWQVLENITPAYGLSFLDKMQFHNLSYVDNDNLAISLGGFTQGVRVVDMAKGYSTLANNGVYSDRTCIIKIERASDGVIYRNVEDKKQVYSEDAAWLMTDVLRGVLEQSYGTGHALKLANKQIAAAKTGTTNSGKDVWFCGYTKHFTTVVWAGYDTPRAMPGASGASITGRIWKNYMDIIHKKLDVEEFLMPEGIVLARYTADGTMIEGTETEPTGKRTAGKEYFSITIAKEKKDSKKNLEQKAYIQEIEKDIRNFEKIQLDSLEEYIAFRDSYKDLRNRISAIYDDDIRNSFATRVKNKYDSLKTQEVDWEAAEKANIEAVQAENLLQAREHAVAAKKASEKKLQKARIRLAKARIKYLKTYETCPENVEELIQKARDAVEACKKYSEYSSLKQELESSITYIRGLKKETDSAGN